MITVQQAIDKWMTAPDKSLPLVVVDTRSGVLDYASVGTTAGEVGDSDDGSPVEDLGLGGKYMPVYIG